VDLPPVREFAIFQWATLLLTEFEEVVLDADFLQSLSLCVQFLASLVLSTTQQGTGFGELFFYEDIYMLARIAGKLRALR
jgi:hypothetical protein